MKEGFWDSILTEEMIASQGAVMEDLAVSALGPIWTESIPKEGGRMALKGYFGGTVDLLPDVSCKSRVHEYGGGAIAVFDDTVYLVNDRDRSVGSFSLKEKKYEVLFTEKNIRFSDMAILPSQQGLYLIGEDCTDEEDVKNAMYFFDRKKKQLKIVKEGHAFFSSPQISKEGTLMAFVTWDFPHMPWQKSDIWVAHIQEDGTLTECRKISFASECSCVQPLWGRDSTLYFISDISGFWNLYKRVDEEIFSLCPMDADCAYPQWKMGRYSYDIIPYEGVEELVFCATDKGIDQLYLTVASRQICKKLSCPLTHITHVRVAPSGTIYLLGGSQNLFRSLSTYELNGDVFSIVQSAISCTLDDSWISTPESVSFPSPLRGKETYGFYYPPKHPNYSVEGRPSPLIVRAHGGPTGHSPPVLSLDVQFWTSRGFGFMDVNYSGSSGYGRAYRERLDGRWGDLDVKECLAAAKWMVELGVAHPSATFIKGSSSGGLTALMALCKGQSFTGAVCSYPVVDLIKLAAHTHKFEKYYLDTLLGTYPKCKSVYIERSPVCHVDKISGSVLIMQGKEDKVVDPSQAEDMYLKLKEKNIHAKLVLFDGEGHGFRSFLSLKKAIENELFFYKSLLHGL